MSSATKILSDRTSGRLPTNRTRRAGRPSGLGQSATGPGLAVFSNEDMTARVVQARPVGNSAVITLEFDLTAVASLVCDDFYLAAIGESSGQFFGGRYVPGGYGTCFKRVNLQLQNVPQGEPVRLYHWWADRFQPWFGATPSYADAIGSVPEEFPEPDYVSQSFPVVSTEEGRSRGIYSQPSPTVGSFFTDAVSSSTGALDSVSQLLKWGSLAVGIGALLWFGWPLLTAASEAASSAVSENGEVSRREAAEKAAGLS